MRAAAALVLLSLCAASPGFCYTVDATTTAEFWDYADAIAVVPIEPCPGGIDCLDMEEDIHDDLLDDVQNVRSAHQVRQALMSINALRLTAENRLAVAQKLKVKAYLVVMIAHTDREETENYNIWVGDKWFLWEDSRNRGSVDVLLITADGGKLIMRGTGHGSSEFRSQKGVLMKIIGEILEKAFESTPRSQTQRSDRRSRD